MAIRRADVSLWFSSWYPPFMIELHIDDDGPRAGERVFLLLHGFTGDTTTWAGVRDALRRHGRTVAIDLVGHGRSPAPEDVAAMGAPPVRQAEQKA